MRRRSAYMTAVFERNDVLTIDGAVGPDGRTGRCKGGFLNDVRNGGGPQRQPSAAFELILCGGCPALPDEVHPHILVKTLRQIPPGEEILLDYGEKYFEAAGDAEPARGRQSAQPAGAGGGKRLGSADCPHAFCVWSGQGPTAARTAALLQAHLVACPFRTAACPVCGREGSPIFVAAHECFSKAAAAARGGPLVAQPDWSYAVAFVATVRHRFHRRVRDLRQAHACFCGRHSPPHRAPPPSPAPACLQRARHRGVLRVRHEIVSRR